MLWYALKYIGIVCDVSNRLKYMVFCVLFRYACFVGATLGAEAMP